MMDWKIPGMSLILWLVLILALANNGHAEKRVVCYYTNWSVYRPGTAKFSPQNINPYLCTHLIYAFGGFTKDNTLKPFDKYQDIEKGGYAKFTGLKTYNKNLKTMLAIGGWNEGSSRFSPMAADPSRRRAFVKNAVKFLRQNHFDGLDLDWEYPAFRDGGKPRDKNNYADLVQELQEEFKRESSKTGRPRLLLSMAIPAGIEYLEKGYDLPRLNEYLDFFNLLSYDYHSAFEPAVNHHSPLYGLEEDNEYNYDNELTIDYTISYLLKHDVSSDKIILGIPTYGRSYTLFNKDATEIGSPADGPGEEGEATREKGYLAYYEICENLDKSDEWEVVQPNLKAMGPYAFRDNQWVGYDDENIVKVKARYVNEKSLGGVMFWSIDNDDFRGKCHERPYPLIEAAKEAMLTSDTGRSQTTQKPKLSGNRKKPKPQSNNQRPDESSSRRLRPEKRRPGATTSSNRKRISSQRSNNRNQGNFEDDDEERIEDAEEEGNAVKETSSKNRSKPAFRNRPNKSGTRRKTPNIQREDPIDEEIEASREQSLSNKLTTPEPPTTPDPGTDFKCEDEGFFSHPRDCKKYFWCLDSGPGGLGIVAHQFTCPSGLVFNKAADSCDYPRNVICPKTKLTSIASTTKAPITAATSKTTFLHSTTRRTTTTEKAESEEEEYEYYDEETNVAENEDKEEAKSTTTAKPLIYKTIKRSKPTTTTSTTEIPFASSPKSFKPTSDRVLVLEDEEDPRVIKELIDLIKKAGGLEQLEKQLNLGEKHSNRKSDSEKDAVTPATISRSLYERVLSRQATKVGGLFGTTTTTTQQPKINKNIFLTDQTTKRSRINYQNGPGRTQFEGLDEIPEVKSLRRTNKPHYVTIERQRPSTTESNSEEDTDDFLADEESVDRDTADVASSEDLAIRDFPGNERESPFKKATHNYVNIRRTRPTTPVNENDFKNKEDRIDEDRQRFSSQERMDENGESKETEKETSIPKSRYTSIQRFRSTTSKSSESFIENSNFSEQQPEIPITTTPIFTQDDKRSSESLVVSTSPLSIEISSTLATKLPEVSTIAEESSIGTRATISTTHQPRTEPTIFVENFVTESALTTLPVLSSSKASVSRTTVSQPQPFGFPRRGRPTPSTSLPNALPSTTEQSRGKVSTRPTKNFVRTRTRPNQRPSELPDENRLDGEEEKILEDKTVNRSRLPAIRRGSSRYSTKAPVANVNSGISNDFSSRRRPTRPTTSAPLIIEAVSEGRPSFSTQRRRGRPTAASSVIESITDSIINNNNNNNNNYNKRRRKPTSRSNINNFSDSPIIRISSSNFEGQFDRFNDMKINSSEPLKFTNIKIIRVLDENEGKNDINNIINNLELTTSESETKKIDSENFDTVTESTVLSSPSLFSRSHELINRQNVDNIIDLTQNVISSTENSIEEVNIEEKKEQEPEVTRRRVLVRRRPTFSTTEANYQSETPSKLNRRRKVIRRLLPISSTTKIVDENESTTSRTNEYGRENEIMTTIDSSGLFTTVRDDEGLISTNIFTNLPSTVDFTTEFGLNPTTSTPDEDILSINNDIESGESTTMSNNFEDSSSATATQTTTTEKPRFVRRKFIRKRPLDFSSTSTSSPSTLSSRRVGFSRPPNDSASGLNTLTKRRKSLFIRRRPVSSASSGADETFSTFRKNTDNDNRDNVDDFDGRDEILSQPKKDSGVSHDTESFWKQYTTSSTPLALTPSFQDSLKSSVDDSSPQESADKPGDIVANRESRTYFPKDDTDNDGLTKVSNLPIFNSFWQNQSSKNRSYPKRTSSTTDTSVTETLIPSRKFDFVADAAYRKHNLQKITTLPFVNDDSTIELTTPAIKPLVTRLVTSIAESGTTERQRILIKTRVSSMTTMTKVSADNKDNLNNVDKKILFDESRYVLLNEIHEPTERVPEKSTLPIENEFARRPRYYFVTEPSIESSTIAIESVFNDLINNKKRQL